MALGEMNRRKSMEQRAAQAPNSSVKEKLESELSEQIGLPGIGQGMNMRINPEGMPKAMPAAQPQMAPRMAEMPVPAIARRMPQQQLSEPGEQPGMANGGLTELPVRESMFNYAPGGIVAFADPSNNQLVGAPETTTASEAPAELDNLPVGVANRILADRLAGKSDLPMPVNREDVKAEILAKNPQYAGILDKLPGEKLVQLAAKLEEQNEAQRERFKQSEGGQGLAALSQALIAAGEATRGQKGMGGIGAAFGGFGKAYNAANAAQEERAAKQQALERAQTIEVMKLQADIEQMQRAYAEGDIEKAMKFKEQIAARQARIEDIKGSTANEVLNQADKIASQADKVRQREEQARHNKEVERYQQIQANTAAQRAKFDREDRPTAEDKMLTKIQANVVRDGGYQILSKKLQDTEVGSDEYYKILDAMRDIALTYYPSDAKGGYKVAPPPKVVRPAAVAKPVEPQSNWDKFINGPRPASPVKPIAVPFDQLPK
jgi:hypothetical protein